MATLKKDRKLVFNTNMAYAGQNYCRMLQGEHSAILLTFIKVPIVIKIFVLSIFEWPFYTGFTVYVYWARLSYLIVFVKASYFSMLSKIHWNLGHKIITQQYFSSEGLWTVCGPGPVTWAVHKSRLCPSLIVGY